MTVELAKLTTPYCILCIPLLIESEHQNFVDRIVLVDCPVELQIERVKKRNGLDEAQIRRIIRSQSSRRQKLNAADDIIVNDGDYAKLDQQVQRLHQFYLSLSYT